MPIIFSNRSTNSHQKRQLLEALLSAGATGLFAASTLVQITKLCIVHNAASPDPLVAILTSLIRANCPLDYKDFAALRHVISSNRTDLIDIFLSSELFNECLASIGFSSIDQEAALDLRFSIASKLLAKGASGEPIHEALIRAVKTQDHKLIQLLVRGGADVGFEHGRSLEVATELFDISALEMLLAAKPKVSLPWKLSTILNLY